MGYIEITGRRCVGDDCHENVADLQCVDKAGTEFFATPAEIAQWLEVTTNVAVVYRADRRKRFIVDVYRRGTEFAFLRTRLDADWTDDFLSLPTFDGRPAAAPRHPRELHLDQTPVRSGRASA